MEQTNYYCFRDYIMEDSEHWAEAAFVEGRVYSFNEKLEAKSELFNVHEMAEERNFSEYFILESDWKKLCIKQKIQDKAVFVFNEHQKISEFYDEVYKAGLTGYSIQSDHFKNTKKLIIDKFLSNK